MDKGLRIIRNVLMIVAFLTLRSPATAAADECSVAIIGNGICLDCDWGWCVESVCYYDTGPDTWITTCE